MPAHLGDDGASRCEAHPERWSSAVCGRCGSYACEACLSDRREATCLRCEQRLPELPWELGGGTLPWRFGASWWMLLRRGRAVLSWLPPGPIRRPLGFAGLVWLVSWVVVIAAARDRAAILVPDALAGSWLAFVQWTGLHGPATVVPLLVVLWSAFAAVVTPMAASLHFGACRTLGGRGSYADTLRAMSYLYAWAALPIAAAAVGLAWQPGVVGLAVAVIALVTGIFVWLLLWLVVARSAVTIARSTHGLTPRRAELASIPLTVAFGAGVWLALSRNLSLGIVIIARLV